MRWLLIGGSMLLLACAASPEYEWKQCPKVQTAVLVCDEQGCRDWTCEPWLPPTIEGDPDPVF